MDTNLQWLSMLTQLLHAPVVSPRGLSTRELLGFKSVVPMNCPVISLMDRRLGYRFMCAEAAWILSGDNKVSTIQPFSQKINQFSDDGYMFFGAYGPKIIQQLPYVIRSLKDDEYTRQAVISIWRESPMKSKDIPCTITLQWLIRDGELHCFANMRSSDVWLGIPYDWFNFSMVSAYLLLILRQLSPAFKHIELGQLHLYAASQHLYESNWAEAEQLIEGMSEIKDIDPIRLDLVGTPERLVKHLWYAADKGAPWNTFMWEVANATKQR